MSDSNETPKDAKEQAEVGIRLQCVHLANGNVEQAKAIYEFAKTGAVPK